MLSGCSLSATLSMPRLTDPSPASFFPAQLSIACMSLLIFLYCFQFIIFSVLIVPLFIAEPLRVPFEQLPGILPSEKFFFAYFEFTRPTTVFLLLH